MIYAARALISEIEDTSTKTASLVLFQHLVEALTKRGMLLNYLCKEISHTDLSWWWPDNTQTVIFFHLCSRCWYHRIIVAVWKSWSIFCHLEIVLEKAYIYQLLRELVDQQSHRHCQPHPLNSWRELQDISSVSRGSIRFPSDVPFIANILPEIESAR